MGAVTGAAMGSVPPPVVGIVDPGVARLGFVDRRAFSPRRWQRAVAAAGFTPQLLSLPQPPALAALWRCAAVINIGDGVYPESRGALTAAVIARWVRDGGIWVELAGIPFLFALIDRRCEPRDGLAPDLLDVVTGAIDGERALRLTPAGRTILGPMTLPPTVLEANAGCPLPLALYPSVQPALTLVETERRESVLSIHHVGAGYLVRWACAARRPLRVFLPNALLGTVAYLVQATAAPARSLPAHPRVILDRLLVAQGKGVGVGIGVINTADRPVQVGCVDLAVHADVDEHAAVMPGEIAASSAWVGEAAIHMRPYGPVDLVARLHGPDATAARAVAELPQAPGRPARSLPLPQRPADFCAFWARGRASLSAVPAMPAWEPLPSGAFVHVAAERVRFRSHGGRLVHGAFCRPDRVERPLPGVLVLPGYGCGYMMEFPARLAALGLCALAVDVRRVGAPDSDVTHASEGMLTHGLDDPESHAYHGGILDCLRGLDILASHPLVDRTRLAVTGSSQGGGLALIVGSLDPRVRAVAAQVPFLCDIVRSATLVESEPLAELRRWLSAHPQHAATAAATLAYFDVANFVSDLRCPALMVFSRNDRVVPVSGVATVIARARSPLTLRNCREGHAAPALSAHRRYVERWLCGRLRGSVTETDA